MHWRCGEVCAIEVVGQESARMATIAHAVRCRSAPSPSPHVLLSLIHQSCVRDIPFEYPVASAGFDTCNTGVA